MASSSENENDYETDEFMEDDEEEETEGNKENESKNTGLCEPPEPKNKNPVRPQDRLAMGSKSKIDKLRESIPIPPDAVPKTHLPNWPQLPLLKKLPNVPAPPGAIVFSRGLVASTLVREHKPFTTQDPYHKQRVPANQYNALHDSHAYNYLQKPEIRNLLIRQGLISCDQEVLCTQKEFNRFRVYLGSMHGDKLRNALADADRQWMTDRHQLLKLYKYKSMQDGKDHERLLKIQNAAKKNDDKQLLKAHKLEEKRVTEESRDCRFRQEKERACLNRKLLGQERDRLVARRKARKNEMELQRRKQLIAQITMKSAAVQERIQNDKIFLRRAYRQFLLEWLDAKYHYQKDKKPIQEEMERKIESDIKDKAQARQDKIERFREMLPDLIAARKDREQRVWNIVRRLFYKWLRKTRDRKSRKPDALHQSLWDAAHVMDDTLKYLRKESGYEKFDEFILNILKLKEEIKLRLAEEEAAELAALETESGVTQGTTDGDAPQTTTETERASGTSGVESTPQSTTTAPEPDTETEE